MPVVLLGTFLAGLEYDLTRWVFTFKPLWEATGDMVNTVFTVTALGMVLVVVLDNRDPVKTTSWLLILLFLPFVGIVLYLFFGRNFRNEKIYSRKEKADMKRLTDLAQDQLQGLDREQLNDPRLRRKYKTIRLLLNNSKSLLTRTNQVNVLNDGTETFGDMLEALDRAEDHIHMEFYSLADDRLGNVFKDLLLEKAAQGVDVKVIYDVGSWGVMTTRFKRELIKGGVRIEPFIPVSFPWFASELNNRNHRKVLVVDGKEGYVGGLNIGDKYLEGDPILGYWRDVHLRVEGEAVHSLQAIFLVDWYFVSEEFLNEHRHFPEVTAKGEHMVQIVPSGPDSDHASIMQAFFSVISNAETYVYISMPYFIPNESILTAMKTAALGGVDVRLILPERGDSLLVNLSSSSFFEELLEAGVKVYLYQKGFNHSKVIMVDDVFSSVGTSNMDMRSFHQNFEVNAILYDEETTKRLSADFMKDIENSRLLDLVEFMDRSYIRRFKESSARLLAPVL